MNQAEYLRQRCPGFEEAVKELSKSEKRQYRKRHYARPNEEIRRMEQEGVFFPFNVHATYNLMTYRFEDGTNVSVWPNDSGMVMVDVKRIGTYGWISGVKSVDYMIASFLETEPKDDKGLHGHRLNAVQKDLEKRVGKGLERQTFTNQDRSMIVFGGYTLPYHELLGKGVESMKFLGYHRVPWLGGISAQDFREGTILVEPRMIAFNKLELDYLKEELKFINPINFEITKKSHPKKPWKLPLESEEPDSLSRKLHPSFQDDLGMPDLSRPAVHWPWKKTPEEDFITKLDDYSKINPIKPKYPPSPSDEEEWKGILGEENIPPKLKKWLKDNVKKKPENPKKKNWPFDPDDKK